MRKRLFDPFRVEEFRAGLSKLGEYEKLKQTYSKEYSQIRDENTSDFWDNLNKEYKVTRNSNPVAFDRFTYFKNKLRIFKDKRILNVGAGSGELEKFIFGQSKGLANWYGIDIAKKSIKVLQTKYPKASFKVAKIQKIPFKNEYFDIIIVSEVMEHIVPNETFKALSEIHRVLKKEGKLIVSVPLNEGLEEMVKRGANPNAHVRVYSRELIKAELEISGFVMINTKFLYAFKTHYWLKTLMARFIPFIRRPNNLIIVAQKK